MYITSTLYTIDIKCDKARKPVVVLKTAFLVYYTQHTGLRTAWCGYLFKDKTCASYTQDVIQVQYVAPHEDYFLHINNSFAIQIWIQDYLVVLKQTNLNKGSRVMEKSRRSTLYGDKNIGRCEASGFVDIIFQFIVNENTRMVNILDTSILCDSPTRASKFIATDSTNPKGWIA